MVPKRTRLADLAEREFIPGFEGFRKRRATERGESPPPPPPPVTRDDAPYPFGRGEGVGRAGSRDEGGRLITSRPVLQDPSIVETGFYAADPSLNYTGRPQLQSEKDFIVNFINQTGARPNVYDVAANQRTLPNPYALDENRIYEPGSLMAQLGFRTGADYRRAQQAEQTYGPFAGERVPTGGLVTYDPATGQPLTRSFEPNAAIRRGEFIPPPGGLGTTQQNVFGQLPESGFYQNYGDIQAPPDLKQFYSGQVTFQAPTLQQAEEQGLVRTDPIDLYGANLYDYLSSQQFPQRGAGGEIFGEGMTIEEANKILDEAEKLIRSGVPVEQLPFYNEAQGINGSETAALREGTYNELVTGLREEWEGRRYAGQGAGAVSSSSGGRGDGRGAQPTGTERGEYLQWIKELGMAHNPTQWAIGQFRNMYDIWLASGSGSFIDWVDDYMAPLEEFEQVPQFGERIQAPRARTLRY